MLESTKPETDDRSVLDKAISLLPDHVLERGLTDQDHELLRSVVGPWPYFTDPGTSEKYPDNFSNYTTDAVKLNIEYEFREELPGPGTPNRLRQNRVLDANPEPVLLRRYYDRLWNVTRTLFNESRSRCRPEFWQQFAAELPPETREAANQMRQARFGEGPRWDQVTNIFRKETFAEMDRQAGGKENYIPALLLLIQIDNISNRFSCDLVSGAAARYCDADFVSVNLCSGLGEAIKALGLQPIDSEALFAGIPKGREYKRR